MNDTAERYRRLSQAFRATVSEITPDGWERPSPCEGWTARNLLRHMVETQGMFLGFVGHGIEGGPEIEDDPAGAWAHASSAVQAQLDDPQAANATFEGFSGTTTFAAAVDRLLCSDLVLHGWDLQRSQGRDPVLDPADMDHVEAAMAPMAGVMRQGAFGPELTPPEGADRQTRFLAYFGRTA